MLPVTAAALLPWCRSAETCTWWLRTHAGRRRRWWRPAAAARGRMTGRGIWSDYQNATCYLAHRVPSFATAYYWRLGHGYTTAIRLRFDGRSTAYQRSSRSQWRNTSPAADPLAAVTLIYLIRPYLGPSIAARTQLGLRSQGRSSSGGSAVQLQ